MRATRTGIAPLAVSFDWLYNENGRLRSNTIAGHHLVVSIFLCVGFDVYTLSDLASQLASHLPHAGTTESAVSTRGARLSTRSAARATAPL